MKKKHGWSEGELDYPAYFGDEPVHIARPAWSKRAKLMIFFLFVVIGFFYALFVDIGLLQGAVVPLSELLADPLSVLMNPYGGL